MELAIWVIRDEVQSGEGFKNVVVLGLMVELEPGAILGVAVNFGTRAEMGQSLNVNLELPPGNSHNYDHVLHLTGTKALMLKVQLADVSRRSLQQASCWSEVSL